MERINGKIVQIMINGRVVQMIPLPPKAVAMWQNLYIASLVPRLSLTAFFAAVFFFFLATVAKEAVREGLGTRLYNSLLSVY